MNYQFPKDLYTDVRIEHVANTAVSFTKRELRNVQVQKYSAAFIRVFDGEMWYYASTSDLDGIQGEINALAAMAKPNPNLAENETYKRLNGHVDTMMVYEGKEVYKVELDDKIAIVQDIFPLLDANGYIKMWGASYLDEYKRKQFFNSKGAKLEFDWQQCGRGTWFDMVDGEKKHDSFITTGDVDFANLNGFYEKVKAEIVKGEDFLLNSVAVEPGVYPVIFAPDVTGVFAHECFGHKSESDFMIGDEATRKEWQLGKRVGSDELTIIETGHIPGSGYTPYDDEGNRATTTYLVKNGILTGRLHNAASAADLGEDITGNGRAVSFEREPVVRMTTTYFDAGTRTYDELIANTQDGILLEKYSHGSGASTFTIAPTVSYLVKDGKIDKPVRVSVVTGNVFEALGNIDFITNKVDIRISPYSGCGKMGHFPLPTGHGGPYIRVQNMQVQ